jgi:hypothetical protein
MEKKTSTVSIAKEDARLDWRKNEFSAALDHLTDIGDKGAVVFLLSNYADFVYCDGFRWAGR